MESPTDQLKSTPTSKPLLNPIIISIILISVVLTGTFFWWSNQKQNELRNEIVSLNDEIAYLNSKLQHTSSTPPVTKNRVAPVSASFTQSDLERIFELSEKEPGTEIYYSDNLGVGFSYLRYSSPYASSSPIKITEPGNRIDFGFHTIEVFTKDPKISLEQAIEKRFLQEYSSSDCFVKVYDTSEQRSSDYVKAEISFPPTNDPSAPWWQNSDKCPQHYSQRNAVRYFLMNKDVPGKFLFVDIGQDSVASDGTPVTEGDGSGWYSSIRILK